MSPDEWIHCGLEFAWKAWERRSEDRGGGGTGGEKQDIADELKWPKEREVDKTRDEMFVSGRCVCVCAVIGAPSMLRLIRRAKKIRRITRDSVWSLAGLITCVNTYTRRRSRGCTPWRLVLT
jgi:hypothetical protein